jgi:hypothetical protein
MEPRGISIAFNANHKGFSIEKKKGKENEPYICGTPMNMHQALR